jgi:KDO2-lipid IV(A) lauroyltransferase
MARRRNPILQFLLAGVVVFFLVLTRILPLFLSRKLTLALGRIAFYVVPRIRRVGLANLDLAYGDELTSAAKHKILRGAVDNIALVAAEFTRVPSLSRGKLGHLVSIAGREHFDDSQPALFVGGHLGNWEWMAPIMCIHDIKSAVIVRPLDNPWLNRVVDGIRNRGGIVTVPKQLAGREILRLLKEDYGIGLLLDQSPRDNSVPVTFFGAPCWATIAPVLLAMRSKIPLYPTIMVRDERGHYTLKIHAPVELVRTGNLRKDLVTNTQRCQDIFEEIVRQYPDQWLWLHRRWKERPELAQEWSRKIGRNA